MVGFPTTFSNTHLPVEVHEAVSAKDTPVRALAEGYPQDLDSNICKPSDDELMQFLRSGRHEALTVLFHRYHRLIYSVAYKLLRDEGEAEDVVQIVFLDVIRKKGLFDPSKGTLKIWLLHMRIAAALTGTTIFNIGIFIQNWVLKRSAVTGVKPGRYRIHGKTDGFNQI